MYSSCAKKNAYLNKILTILLLTQTLDGSNTIINYLKTKFM